MKVTVDQDSIITVQDEDDNTESVDLNKRKTRILKSLKARLKRKATKSLKEKVEKVEKVDRVEKKKRAKKKEAMVKKLIRELRSK